MNRPIPAILEIDVDVEKMREILYCTKKYYAVNQFINRVAAAIKEIGDHLQCDYIHGTYNKVKTFHFSKKYKTDK